MDPFDPALQPDTPILETIGNTTPDCSSEIYRGSQLVVSCAATEPRAAITESLPSPSKRTDQQSPAPDQDYPVESLLDKWRG